MTDYIEAWCCLGCGRIEAPQPCIGVCRDQKVRLIPSADYETALNELAEAHKRLSSARDILSRLALVTPRTGKWESTYRILQQHDRAAMPDLDSVQK